MTRQDKTTIQDKTSEFESNYTRKHNTRQQNQSTTRQRQRQDEDKTTHSPFSILKQGKGFLLSAYLIVSNKAKQTGTQDKRRHVDLPQ